MIDSKQQDKTLALAGIFQAAKLVDLLSTTGKAPVESLAESINSIFQTNPSSVSEVYDSVSQAELGVYALQMALSNPRHQSASRWMTYSKALIRVERVTAKHQALHTLAKARIDHYKRHFGFFDSVTCNSLISKLGNLYVDTAGLAKYRVIIHGQPSFLMSRIQKERLCAVLFAGIRSAHLWRELGGSEWELIFLKKRILRVANTLSSRRS